MKTIALPEELNLKNTQAVQVFEYTSSKEIAKQQIILNQNVFSFLVEGNKEVHFDNSAVAIDKSKFLIMKSGHCLMTERLSSNQNYKSILLFFSNEILTHFLRKLDSSTSKPKEHKSVYSFNYDNYIHQFIQSLLSISLLSVNTQNKLLSVKLEEILLYLTEIYGQDFLYGLAMHSGDTTQKFIRTVESNQFNKLSLKELAFLCDMSVSTFKREFEKHFTESPMKWFQNKRLEFAHHLLTHEQKNASEIYFEVGYESLSSFVQAYKAKYGITPKQHHKN